MIFLFLIRKISIKSFLITLSHTIFLGEPMREVREEMSNMESETASNSTVASADKRKPEAKQDI